MNYKQVILIRQDLKLPKGKACSQVAHASVDATLKSDPSLVKSWRDEGMAKIVVKVQSEKELIRFFQTAKDEGLTASLISDAGHTVVEPGTRTCVGIGPDTVERVDSVTGELPLL